MLGEMLDRLTTMLGHPPSLSSMFGEVCQRSKMLDEYSQHFLCSEILGQLLDRLITSPNIVGYVSKLNTMFGG